MNEYECVGMNMKTYGGIKRRMKAREKVWVNVKVYEAVDEGVWKCVWSSVKGYEGVCSYGKGRSDMSE